MLEEITLEKIIEVLETVIEEAKNDMNIEGTIDENSCPGLIIKSQVLVSLIGSIEDLLNIEIPNKCYPFFDEENMRQLTIRQAAEILKKESKNAR